MTGGRPATRQPERTRFVRVKSARRPAAIAIAFAEKKRCNNLRGEVVTGFFLRECLKRFEIAGVNSDSWQFMSTVAQGSVTQKPTRLVISWRRHNCR
jgi:hypothetical protein